MKKSNFTQEHKIGKTLNKKLNNPLCQTSILGKLNNTFLPPPQKKKFYIMARR